MLIDEISGEVKTQKKTVTTGGVDTKGTQENQPMDSSTFDRDLQAAKIWVGGHTDGQRVYVGKMKSACDGGANWQHEAILNGLKKAKLLRKKENGGTSPLYYKREIEAIDQVSENIKKTGKLIQLFKSK